MKPTTTNDGQASAQVLAIALCLAATAAPASAQVRESKELTLKGADAMVPLQGGVPIIVEGQVVGAIGVSGETPAIDEGIAGAKVAKSFKTKRSSSSEADERKTR